MRHYRFLEETTAAGVVNILRLFGYDVKEINAWEFETAATREQVKAARDVFNGVGL